MGGGAPYLYTPTNHNGSTFDFNPRAYTQATYARSIEQQSPKPKQEGPLIDLNRHPDSWMVVTPNPSNVEPMSPNTRVKVLTCRGIQLFFRILQLIGALGLFVCVICIRGFQDVQGWIMRIPPAYDALLNLYAIYHLVRPAHSRPAGSSASYNFFALMMDGALIPFYVYTAMFSYSNYMQVPNTEGRWRTFFDNDDATAKVLWTAFLTACTVGGMHVISMVLDLLLLIWFRKISNMPPDMNPLDVGPKLTKHKHKNSELSVSTLTTEQKHLSAHSTDSLPIGVPSPQYRQIPFSHSRLDSDPSFNPHTLHSARYQRSNTTSPSRPTSFYNQPLSAHASRTSFRPADVHSPFAGHVFPFPPGQDHTSLHSRPTTAVRTQTSSPAPSAAQDPRDARKAQSQSLLRDNAGENWTVLDEGDNVSRGPTPTAEGRRRAMTTRQEWAPPLPAKSERRISVAEMKALDGFLGWEGKENVGERREQSQGQAQPQGVARQGTVSSSVYSDDQSAFSVGTARMGTRFYGDLGGRGMEGYHGEERVVSRSGVELRDDGPVGVRGRNVSGKNAEEGRAGWAIADFTHAVIGGGAVGLAIARKLQQRDGVSTILIEKHGAVGTETSSRNSEVIHAGLYYAPDSLKARLCIRGKELLYDLCNTHSIPHRQCGKWIVAQDDTQHSALETLHARAQSLAVPTRFLSASEIATEPSVRASAGALLSPTTGILDSHTYMSFLHGDFSESGGDTAFGAQVVSIDAPSASTSDWTIHVRSGPEDAADSFSVTASTLINSAGLYAVDVANMVLPPDRHLRAFYAKGTYFSYASKHPRPNVLVYPAPVEGHGGLGTHLTLDLQGRVRFGPDVQWIDTPDYVPDVDAARFEEAVREIRTYLPEVEGAKIETDYCGVRPKLAGKEGGGGKDFYIKREDGWGGTFVNLCGIESPGLTGSLAIGEMVDGLLYK
ncbi:L-2-hydroxyglutarate dehydrogenase, mitochondrial [Sphaceloma murrayae]|uniref:L-2-hydroxyglutarate dehydrogenase, mitochondrial n=1 Tax=Sphaceloma murrayae TaxID=2082308 RepID=A0A2K1R170_9PEZI|nr:L-2-hydroxyglutarate dehydrogenase, mitochondrial [Sphaceloma murrayae]